MKKIIGVDIGDKENVYVVQDEQGLELAMGRMKNESKAFTALSEAHPSGDFVIEAGGHSRWISAWLEDRGHKVVVGNPRHLRLVWKSDEKSDSNDARLLVSCAQRILGPHGQDSTLRRHGLRIAARGGQNAKKRAVVAVARKLAVLLHRLWADGADYQPNYKKNRAAA